MQPTVLPDGKVQVQQPDHPDYQRLMAQSLPVARPVVTPDYTKMRLFASGLIVIGLAAWWYHWHTAQTEGVYSMRLAFLSPTGVLGGLMLLLRPDWHGRITKESSTAQKAGVFGVLALICVAFGIDMYAIEHYPFHQPTSGAYTSRVNSGPAATVHLMGRIYLLKSFQVTRTATWEFTQMGEPLGDWTSMITLIDRPDATQTVDLDRLASGIQSRYSTHGGEIVAAKTYQDDSGKPYNFLVASFDEAGQRRAELNFVKVAMGPRHAMVAIYAVRVSDPADYKTTAQQFIATNSTRIREALSRDLPTDLDKLPRKGF